MNPKISIITITYNSEKTVEETIKSVISQDYSNFEYIIIDGVSTDKTLDIVNKYKDDIAVISSEKDKGISDAFNKGILKASGEIIGIINSDDLLLPGALAKVAENYNPNIEVYSGNVLFWDDETGKTLVDYPELDFSKLKAQYGVAHQSRFITKEAYLKYGLYDIRFRYNMDTELLCRFFKKGAKFAYIDEVLTKYRLGGTTADPIYKKKNDYKLFVECYGGSKFDFYKIWVQVVIKYNLIQLSYMLFGKDFRYTLHTNPFYRRFLLPIVKFFYKEVY